MPITYSIADILEIAQVAERNGAKFYRKAAVAFPDPELKKLLLDLAAMEDAHVIVFAGIRAGLSEADYRPLVSEPSDRPASYVDAVAEGRVLDFRADPSSRLTGHETLADILKIAIQLEKDAIVFYSALRERAPRDTDKIQFVIRQEMKHVAQLSEELAALN